MLELTTAKNQDSWIELGPDELSSHRLSYTEQTTGFDAKSNVETKGVKEDDTNQMAIGIAKLVPNDTIRVPITHGCIKVAFRRRCDCDMLFVYKSRKQGEDHGGTR